MKTKLIILLGFLWTISIEVKAQDEIDIYRKLFVYSDSISKTDNKGIINQETYKSLSILERGHPAGIFEKVGTLLQSGKFNDAALVYYVGYFRYRYYNLVNPGYKASEDGALLGSLKYITGEQINLFLRSDIDNFIKILDHAKVWLTNNDYSFFSKTKNIKKYNEEISQLDTLINDLTTNKKKFQTLWSREQVEMRKAMTDMNDEKQKTKKKS